MRKIFLVLMLAVGLAAAQNAVMKTVEKLNAVDESPVVGWTQSGESVHDIEMPGQNGFWQFHDGVAPVRVNISAERDPLLEVSWQAKGREARFSDRWQYDMAMPLFKPSADGTLMMSIDIGNRLRLIDSDGTIRSSFAIVEEYKYDSENIVMAAADSDLKTILTGVTQFEDGRPFTTLTLRTRENEILLSRTFDGHYLRSLELTDDGALWGACVYTAEPFIFNTFAADRQGNILAQSQQRSRRILFSDDGRTVFFDKNALQVFNLQSGQQTGSYRLDNPQKIITDAAFDAESRTLVVQESAVLRNTGSKTYPWKFSDIVLTALDQRASTIAQQKMKEITVLQPSLWYDGEKQAFFLGHTEGAEWLRMEVQ